MRNAIFLNSGLLSVSLATPLFPALPPCQDRSLSEGDVLRSTTLESLEGSSTLTQSRLHPFASPSRRSRSWAHRLRNSLQRGMNGRLWRFRLTAEWAEAARSAGAWLPIN